jgi:hypothetical protein
MESFFVQIDAIVNSINNQIVSARVKCEPKLNNILISYKETLTKVLDKNLIFNFEILFEN